MIPRQGRELKSLEINLLFGLLVLLHLLTKYYRVLVTQIQDYL